MSFFKKSIAYHEMSQSQLDDFHRDLLTQLSEIKAEMLRREKLEEMKRSIPSNGGGVSTKKKVIKNYAISTSDEEEVGIKKKVVGGTKKATTTTTEDAEDRYKKWTIPKMIQLLDKNKIEVSKYLKRDEYVELVRTHNLVREMHRLVEKETV